MTTRFSKLFLIYAYIKLILLNESGITQANFLKGKVYAGRRDSTRKHKTLYKGTRFI